MTSAGEPHAANTSAYDNSAFRDVLRKLVDTPKADIERGLSEQKTARIKKRKTVKAK